jgi:hypothetical protein
VGIQLLANKTMSGRVAGVDPSEEMLKQATARNAVGCTAHAQAKLDHCVIHVSNWARSNAFYRDVLGELSSSSRATAGPTASAMFN